MEQSKYLEYFHLIVFKLATPLALGGKTGDGVLTSE